MCCFIWLFIRSGDRCWVVLSVRCTHTHLCVISRKLHAARATTLGSCYCEFKSDHLKEAILFMCVCVLGVGERLKCSNEKLKSVEYFVD